MPVPSIPPQNLMAHTTSFNSIAIAWNGIPLEQANGLLKGYIVRLDGSDSYLFVCANKRQMTIRGLKKSKVYKLQVAGFTSKGQGVFSDYVVAMTNLDGRL